MTPPRLTTTQQFLVLLLLYGAIQWYFVFHIPSAPTQTQIQTQIQIPPPPPPSSIAPLRHTDAPIRESLSRDERLRRLEAIRSALQDAALPVISEAKIVVVVGAPGVTLRVATDLLESGGLWTPAQRLQDGDSALFASLVHPEIQRAWKDTAWSMGGKIDSELLLHLHERMKTFIETIRLKKRNENGMFDQSSADGVSAWAFQSHEAGLILPLIKEFFPNSLILHVIEDGRYASLDTRYRMVELSALSRILLRETVLKDDSQKKKVYAVANLWQRLNSNISLYGEALFESKYKVLRIEDFCSDLQKSIAAFLSEMELAEYPEEKVEKRLIATRGNDLKQSCSRPIGLYRHQKYLGEKTLVDVQEICRAGLKEFKYLDSIPYHYLMNEDELQRMVDLVAEDNIVIVTFVTASYHRLLFNWLIGMEVARVRNILPICLDYECASFLRSVPVLHYFDPSTCCPKKYWEILDMRTQYIYRILRMGYDVMISDVDALWSRNPLPVMKAQKADLQAMAGRFPHDLYRKWKWGTMNCGLVLFRSTDPTMSFLDKMMTIMLKQPDDQVSANKVFDQNGVVWNPEAKRTEQCILGNCNIGSVDSMNLTVILMDKRLFVTACRSKDISDEPPFVIHAACTEKEEGEKVDFLVSMKVWFLKDSWGTIIPSNQTTLWDYSSSKSTLMQIIKEQKNAVASVSTVSINV